MNVTIERKATVLALAAEAGAIPCSHVADDGWVSFVCPRCIYTDAAGQALAAFFAAACGWMGVR